MLPDASGALVDDGCVICKGKEHKVSKDTRQVIGRTLRLSLSVRLQLQINQWRS